MHDFQLKTWPGQGRITRYYPAWEQLDHFPVDDHEMMIGKGFHVISIDSVSGKGKDSKGKKDRIELKSMSGPEPVRPGAC